MRGSLVVAGAAMGQLLSLSVGGAALRRTSAGDQMETRRARRSGCRVGPGGPLPVWLWSLAYLGVSSLWTPGGEHPVDREREGSAPPPSAPGPEEELTSEEQAELEAQMAAVQQELLGTPVAVVIANHAVGLFQLAALHLNQRPPNLEEGRLAVDAMGALVEGLSGRLGEEEASLKEALAQLRMAYVSLTRESGQE